MARRSAEEIRASVIAGASVCFRDLGIAGTSVEDIVAASGVARSTLYRHVGDRDDVVLAVALAEIDQLRSELVSRIDTGGSVIEALVEGVLHAVDLVHGTVVLHQLVASPELMTSDVSDHAIDALVARLHEFVGPLFDEGRGAIRHDLELAVAVECLVRTITSLVGLGVRSDRTRTDRRDYLRQTIVPVFVADDVVASLASHGRSVGSSRAPNGSTPRVDRSAAR